MAATLDPSPPNHEQHDTTSHHAPPKRTLWQRVTENRFLFISIIVHVLFGLAAAAWVVQTITAKRKLTFTSAPPSPNPSTRAMEHRVQMAKKQQTMSAPAMPKRIVSTGLAKVTLPEMPAMPAMNSIAAPTKMAGVGGTGVGFGPSAGVMGSGASGGGGGPVPLFGLRSGAGLAGTFYDLKQDKDGKPTDMALQPNEQGAAFDIEAPVNKAYDRALSSFLTNGMSESSLSKYFRGPQTLYLTQLYIPAVSAEEAPKAFNLGNRVKGRRWVVVYRGKVTAPESGRYRFAGFGDDVLVVRLDGRVVLDAGFAKPTRNGFRPPQYGKEEFSEPVDIRAGVAYPMEVLIGERPGGLFVGYLLLEKQGVEYKKDKTGAPKLPIFKLSPSDMPKGGKVAPEAAPDTTWSVWKGQPQQTMFGGF
jgi:PA14 domain